MTEQGPQIPFLDDYNGWADFWRNSIGINVIPADTEKKRTYENWKEWQEKPITAETHNSWKTEEVFSRNGCNTWRSIS